MASCEPQRKQCAPPSWPTVLSRPEAAAKTSRSEVGHKGGEAENYEDRTKEELVDRAREVGIKGRSKMSKSELIDALRNS